jgi:sulfur carrier protein
MEHLIYYGYGAYDAAIMRTMTIEINGKKREIPIVSNVRELLLFLEISESRLAIEINRKIIHRNEWDTTPVEDNDRVEIVRFIGGG